MCCKWQALFFLFHLDQLEFPSLDEIHEIFNELLVLSVIRGRPFGLICVLSLLIEKKEPNGVFLFLSSMLE